LQTTGRNKEPIRRPTPSEIEDMVYNNPKRPPGGATVSWVRCTLNAMARYKKMPIGPSDWFERNEVERWFNDFGPDKTLSAFRRFVLDKQFSGGEHPLRRFKNYICMYCMGATPIESFAYGAGKLAEARMKEFELGAYNPRGRKTLIIVASRKTDIPALYGTWFRNRLDAGYCKVRRRKDEPATISLKREDVDGFVFRTKNIGPFMPTLAVLNQRRFPFYIHHTINNYSKDLEPHAPPFAESMDNMRKLRGLYGADVAVWRYDPIIITRQMTKQWHLDNFAKLAESLRGSTNEVVTSFIDIDRYKKVRKKKENTTRWSDLSIDQKKLMVRELAAIAKKNEMELTICCRKDVRVEGVLPSRCVDADRLGRIARATIDAKPKPCCERCGCWDYEDIGDWNTCSCGCLYCDVTETAALARSYYLAHDEHGESLIPLVKGSDIDKERAELFVPGFPPGDSPVRGDRYWAGRPLDEHVSREQNEARNLPPAAGEKNQ